MLFEEKEDAYVFPALCPMDRVQRSVDGRDCHHRRGALWADLCVHLEVYGLFPQKGMANLPALAQAADVLRLHAQGNLHGGLADAALYLDAQGRGGAPAGLLPHDPEIRCRARGVGQLHHPDARYHHCGHAGRSVPGSLPGRDLCPGNRG